MPSLPNMRYFQGILYILDAFQTCLSGIKYFRNIISAWKYLRYFVAVYKGILRQGRVRLSLWFQKQGCKCHRCLCYPCTLGLFHPKMIHTSQTTDGA